MSSGGYGPEWAPSNLPGLPRTEGLIVAAARIIRDTAGPDADRSTAAAVLDLWWRREELSDEQVEQVLSEFPYHVVAELEDES